MATPEPNRPPSPLLEVATQRVCVRTPFSFKTTVSKPSHFPTPLEAMPDPDTYLTTAYVDEELLGFRAKSIDAPTVELTLYAPSGGLRGAPTAVFQEIARRMGLFVDVSGFSDVWRRDAQLSDLPPELAGGRPSMPHSLYGFLMVCVLLQNTQVRRTVQMAEVMLGRFQRRVAFPDGTVLPTLWTPEDILASSEDELRSLKLGYRARTIRKLSQQFAADPRIETRLMQRDGSQAIDDGLRELYGVGPATAGYSSFEWFKQVDHLVHLSPWETKISARLLFGDDNAGPDAVIAEARRRWAPFTMLALHALFESVFWKRAESVGPKWLEDLIRL